MQPCHYSQSQGPADAHHLPPLLSILVSIQPGLTAQLVLPDETTQTFISERTASPDHHVLLRPRQL